MAYAIEMLHITKDFPGIRANDDITLQVEENTVHALLGENGAGKSTLMSILFGLYQPTSGTIKVNGKEVKISDPNVANDLGIGMVHQHFKLIECFTVTENIILGKEPRTKLGTVDMKKAREKVVELSKRYGLQVDPDAKISNITVGMQQRVEILKMLYRDAKILIFDEPTAVLTPQEIAELMQIMQNLVKEGKTILLITHKLKEIKAAAQKCTVLRKGRCIGTIDVKDTSEEKMAEMMVGRVVTFMVDRPEARPGDVYLDVDHLNVKSAKGTLAVKDFSLKIRAGEIVGLAGIDGNGQTELAFALTGMTKIESGTVKFMGEDVTHASIMSHYRHDMCHVPEDRHKHGLILDFTLKENYVVHSYMEEPFSKNGVIKMKAIDEYADRLSEEYDVRSGEGKDTITRSMSGGNQQKAIVAREFDRNSKIMIVVQPTRGLDVGAIELVRKKIVEQRDKGAAVLLISLELDEIMNLSDRIAVIHNGSLSGLVMNKDVTENEIGLMMSGGLSKFDEEAKI